MSTVKIAFFSTSTYDSLSLLPFLNPESCPQRATSKSPQEKAIEGSPSACPCHFPNYSYNIGWPLSTMSTNSQSFFPRSLAKQLCFSFTILPFLVNTKSKSTQWFHQSLYHLPLQKSTCEWSEPMAPSFMNLFPIHTLSNILKTRVDNLSGYLPSYFSLSVTFYPPPQVLNYLCLSVLSHHTVLGFSQSPR